MKLIKISQNIKYDHLREEEQLKMVQRNTFSIKFIPNPSQEVQLEAVKQYGRAIRHIKNPSQEVQIEAVKENAYAIRHIPNPSLKVQLIAVTGRSATHIIQNIKYFIPNQHPELVKEYIKWILNEINKT